MERKSLTPSEVTSMLGLNAGQSCECKLIEPVSIPLAYGCKMEVKSIEAKEKEEGKSFVKVRGMQTSLSGSASSSVLNWKFLTATQKKEIISKLDLNSIELMK